MHCCIKNVSGGNAREQRLTAAPAAKWLHTQQQCDIPGIWRPVRNPHSTEISIFQWVFIEQNFRYYSCLPKTFILLYGTYLQHIVRNWYYCTLLLVCRAVALVRMYMCEYYVICIL